MNNNSQEDEEALREMSNTTISSGIKIGTNDLDPARNLSEYQPPNSGAPEKTRPRGGLISRASNKNTKSQPYEAESVNPVVGTVGENSTVEGRLTGLLDDNGKYIQQARRNAQNFANRRGLINSSMAASAGEKSAIESALPIAQQDANTYSEQDRLNQSTVNKFRENEQSTELNKELSSFEQQNKEMMAKLQSQLDMDKETHTVNLRKELEMVIADKKFSNDMKITYAQEMSRIMTESQTQIGAIGSSDRKGKQQAAAIRQVVRQRDAQIQLLKKQMAASTNWNW